MNEMMGDEMYLVFSLRAFLLEVNLRGANLSRVYMESL
jgi:hypothetical protein